MLFYYLHKSDLSHLCQTKYYKLKKEKKIDSCIGATLLIFPQKVGFINSCIFNFLFNKETVCMIR